MNKLNDYLMQFRFYRAWEESAHAPVLNWGIFVALALVIANGIVDTVRYDTAYELAQYEARQAQLAASSRATPDNNRAQEKSVTSSEPQETNRVIVKFKESGLPPGLSVAAERANLEKAEGLKKLFTIAGINADVYEVSEDSTAREVVDRVLSSKRDLVEYAEVDMRVGPALVPNDPNLGNAWHISKIVAQNAWEKTQGDGIIIAIADTGVDCTHPDLAASCVPGWNVYANNNVTNDTGGHGTAVAGVAAQIGNNAVGSAGLAYRAKIMPIQITDGASTWAYFSDMAEAIVYAADHGARVVNVSYEDSCGAASVVNAASYMRSKGGVVTLCAGNQGKDAGMAVSDSTTCLSATDALDNRASWSNYGAYIDLGAPGVSMYTTERGGGYGIWKGTSFAAPIAAGIYALMFSANPNLTPSQADNILYTTADDLGTPGWDMYYGYGRVNAAKAVAMAASTTGNGGPDTQAPSVPMNLQASNLSATQVTLTWSPSTDNVGVAGYDLYRGSTKLASIGGTQYTDTTLQGSSSYTYAVAARDAAGNTSGQSASVFVTTPSAPLSLTSQSVSVKTGTTATVQSTTNKPATVTVKYGTSATALTLTAAGPATESTTQSVSLSGLKPKTKYFYQVIGTTLTGETTASAVSNFRTGAR